MQYQQNGGRGCNSSINETEPCALMPCAVLKKKDCKWSDWSTWSVCDKCSGQRNRVRHIAQMPKNRGEPCAHNASEESAGCPRACGKDYFCEWGDWSVASTCTKKCGPERKRLIRHLELIAVNVKTSSSSWEAKHVKLYDADDFDNRYGAQELVMSFGCGILISFVLLFLLRRWSCSQQIGYQQFSQELVDDEVA